MTEQNSVTHDEADEKADALAAVVVISLIIGAVCYWLAGMPM